MAAVRIEDLLRIDTFVEYYIKGDEEFIKGEYDISYLPLESLLTIFTPEPKDDYELVFTYEIDKELASKLNAFLKEPILFDFENYDYAMQRYGIYRK
ncbi:DUF7683 domain-containing protein [Flavobacterium rhizosphaerae]|uniref:DUF7683 domain-containing protein n=1 Tax=Flavobacterium rhizosphaerae TaxID=3163298 RepID=A0ABW8YVR4_9FLAO